MSLLHIICGCGVNKNVDDENPSLNWNEDESLTCDSCRAKIKFLGNNKPAVGRVVWAQEDKDI